MRFCSIYPPALLQKEPVKQSQCLDQQNIKQTVDNYFTAVFIEALAIQATSQQH